MNGGEIPRQIGKKRRFRVRQRDTHGVIIYAVNGGDEFCQLQALKVRVVAAGYGVIGIFCIHLPHKRKNHVVRIEVASRREKFIAVEFYAFAQMEGVNPAIGADLPAFCQRRL